MNKNILGKEYPPFEFPVERGKIREMAGAVDDDNPIYADPEYARKTKFGGIIAPPNYAVVAGFWGNWDEVMKDLDRKPGHTGHAEDEYIYYKPIHAGETLTGRNRIAEIYEKTSRKGGKVIFAVIETTFYNEKKEKVLVVRSTSLETEDVVN